MLGIRHQPCHCKGAFQTDGTKGKYRVLKQELLLHGLHKHSSQHVWMREKDGEDEEREPVVGAIVKMELYLTQDGKPLEDFKKGSDITTS